MNEFDKLFNEYFGENYDGLDKIMGLMSKLNSGGDLGGLNPEENLGEPDTKREFERDGIIFEESTWETPHGTIVRIVTKEEIEFSSDFFKKNNIPFGRTKSKPVELSLEEQLENAKKIEDYEECAILRDKIMALKEEKIAGDKEISKKENKNEASENLDNKGIVEDDEWNF